MKKFSIFRIAVLTASVLVCTPSCNKDKDDDNGGNPVDVISATVENGASLNGKVDEVKALLFGMGSVVIATGSYAEGKFKIDLPETVPAGYLSSMFDDAVPNGVTVSNPKTKVRSIDFFTAYKDGSEVGEFYYCTADGTVAVSYLYADGDVTVKGSYTDEDGDTEKYDMNLKKGWNELYITVTESKDGGTFTYSSSKPAGLKWIFYPDSNYSEEKSAVKRASKSFLRK